MASLDEYLRARELLKGGPEVPPPGRSEDNQGPAEVGDGTTNVCLPGAPPVGLAPAVIYAERLRLPANGTDVVVANVCVEHFVKRDPVTIDALDGDMVMSLHPTVGKLQVRWGSGADNDPRVGEVGVNNIAQVRVARKIFAWHVPVEVPLPPEPDGIAHRAFDLFVEPDGGEPVLAGRMYREARFRPDNRIEFAEHWILDPHYDPPGRLVVNGTDVGAHNVRVQAAVAPAPSLAAFIAGANDLPTGTRYAQVVFTFEPLTPTSR